jgi:fatty-acyl-CoA synthase
MMDFPLTLPTILERARRIFPRVEIVSQKPDKSITRTCYGEFHSRARRLASSLTKLGMKRGDRVASMMWNHSKHLEAFFGVPCGGGILHTLNLRLHPHEIAVIAKHAGDRFLLIDDVLLPVYERFHQDAPFEHVIVVSHRLRRHRSASRADPEARSFRPADQASMGHDRDNSHRNFRRTPAAHARLARR